MTDSRAVPRPARALLATLTPGAELARAFGHVALVFEERGAASTFGDAQGDLVAYSYGGLILPEIRVSSGDFGSEQLWDAVGAAVHASLAPVVHGTFQVHKQREGFGSFLRHAAPEQRCQLEELRLSARVLERLHQRVLVDFSRIEPGQRRVGTYAYDHFRSNCATRVRDVVFGALGHDREHDEQRATLEVSFEQVMLESLALAVAASPGGVRLFPDTWQTGLAALLPGIPLAITEPGAFLSVLELALAQLATAAIFRTPEGNKTLTRAFHLLKSEIPRSPRRAWDTLLTPQRLRAALLATRTSSESAHGLLAPSAHSTP